jgi:hypothetical protein
MYWHGLRDSEIVGKKTKIQASVDTLAKAQARCRDFPGSTVRETKRKTRRGWVPLFHVVTPKPILTGGLTADNFSDGYIRIKRLKGSKATNQELQVHENELLNERALVEAWIKEHPQGRLFPLTRQQLWRLMRLYCKRAKVPAHKAHPHIWKHSIGHKMIEDGATLPEVQARLGHTSIQSTGVYTEVGDQEATAALKRGEARRKDIGSVSRLEVDSLGGVSVEEGLRRLLRQLEQDKEKKAKRKR